MAVTLTPRFGQPQWSSGADAPNRSLFNAAFLALDQKGALDDGAQSATLPTTDIPDGRYAHLVNGTTRQLYRRGGGVWSQVGGNTWGETTYQRALSGAQGGSAREVGHAGLASASVVESWDGSSVRGGRQAVGDVNASVPSALHVGDTASAVDLVTRGRVWVRTTGAGHRGLVASAHAADAGPLFTARDPGGGDPWTVDAQGRMRAQVPTAFGGATFAAGVPVSVAPGVGDTAGVDLYAAASKPALRLLRAAGDAVPIGLVEQDRITLGRAGWTGGRVDLVAPTVAVTGAATLQDTVVAGTLGVSGVSTLAAVTASSVTAAELVRGQTVDAVGVLSAESGRIKSQAVGSVAADLESDYTVAANPTTPNTTHALSLRAPVCQMVRADSGGRVVPKGGTTNVELGTLIVRENTWVRTDMELAHWRSGNGTQAARAARGSFALVVYSNSGRTAEVDRSWAVAFGSVDDGHYGYAESTTGLNWVWPKKFTAGTYYLRAIITADNVADQNVVVGGICLVHQQVALDNWQQFTI